MNDLFGQTLVDPDWDLEAVSEWLRWATYVALAGLGLVLGASRSKRVGLVRWLAPRVSSAWFHRLRYVLVHRLVWLTVRTLCLFALFLLFGSVVMYYVERNGNAKFHTLEEASHSTLIYLFSGIEDRTPQTTPGWFCFSAMALASLGLTAYYTGYVVSEIIERRKTRMEGAAAARSFLVIGWNPRARWVIEELFRAFEVGLDRHVITVLSREKVDTAQCVDLDARAVTFVSGDAFDKKVLELLGAHQAYSVIVLADKSFEDPDAHSTLTVLALRALCQDQGIPPERRPRVCVEVVNHRKLGLLHDAGADEAVCHEDYGLGVLTQAALMSKITQVYQELLSHSPQTNEIYVLRTPRAEGPGDVPRDVWEQLLLGKSFSQAAEVFNACRDPRNPAILLGLRRGEKMLLNPREALTLQPGDDLIVLACVFPNLEHFRRLLAERAIGSPLAR